MAMVLTTGPDRATTERLAAHELRYTSGRRMIVSVLRTADGPVTLLELLESAGGVPQTSTYRTLSVMEEAGLGRRVRRLQRLRLRPLHTSDFQKTTLWSPGP